MRLQTNNTKDDPLTNGQQKNETQPFVSEAALRMKHQPGRGAGPPENLP